MFKIGDRVMIYRGNDAGLQGTVVATDTTNGISYLVVRVGNVRKYDLHIPATDVRMASCLEVGRN